MNQTILGLAVMVAVMGATVARADDCGPQPSYAPQGQSWNQGSYQLQTQQVWVAGQSQQVWVPGNCAQYGGGYGGVYVRTCSPGYYRTVASAGHYENRQEWVWVASYGNGYENQQYGQYQYGRNGNGNRYNHGRHGRHGAVPVGY